MRNDSTTQQEIGSELSKYGPKLWKIKAITYYLLKMEVSKTEKPNLVNHSITTTITNLL